MQAQLWVVIERVPCEGGHHWVERTPPGPVGNARARAEADRLRAEGRTVGIEPWRGLPPEGA